MCAPSPPPAPDYAAQAAVQGQENRQAALDTALLSNPNIITPYGTQTVSYGYPGMGSAGNGLFDITDSGQLNLNVGMGAGPRRGASTSGPTFGQVPQPTITQTFAPELQQQFDAQNRIINQLNSTAESGLGRVSDAMATPFDTSGLPNVDVVNTSNLPGVRDLTTNGLNDFQGIDTNALASRTVDPTVGGFNQVYDAMVQRQNPQFNKARQDMEAELISRGFVPGTEGYNQRLDEINRQQNDYNLAATQYAGQEQQRLFDMESQLRAQGLSEQQIQSAMNNAIRGQQFGENQAMTQSDMARRQQSLQEQDVQQASSASERERAIQEQAYLRNLPLTELNALRTGGMPNLPQFQQYTGANVQAAPYMDAAIAQGNYNLAANQQQGGLFDLLGAGLGAAGAAGGFGNLFSFAPSARS